MAVTRYIYIKAPHGAFINVTKIEGWGPDGKKTSFS